MPVRCFLFAVCVASFIECRLVAQDKAENLPPGKAGVSQSADGKLSDGDAEDESKVEKEPKWSVERPSGTLSQQQIDVSEGTWISVDVHPSGKEIVFDLLGDLYVMPISGADGTAGEDGAKQFPEKLSSGIAWDFQPRFSHDGK